MGVSKMNENAGANEVWGVQMLKYQKNLLERAQKMGKILNLPALKTTARYRRLTEFTNLVVQK